jgi:hypothetical protein
VSTVALPASPGELDAVYAKMAKRIIPFLELLFVMAWLDRQNFGFAKLQNGTVLRDAQDHAPAGTPPRRSPRWCSAKRWCSAVDLSAIRTADV